ncbi:hypothetical protein MRX96_008824 [Rhipicephalus microplus]
MELLGELPYQPKELRQDVTAAGSLLEAAAIACAEHLSGSGYGSSAGGHQSGHQGGASGHNQGFGAFAGGASHSTVNAFNKKQGYSHSSGFSSSDRKTFGTGFNQGSSGFKKGAVGHQAGYGQSSHGHTAVAGVNGVANLG